MVLWTREFYSRMQSTKFHLSLIVLQGSHSNPVCR